MRSLKSQEHTHTNRKLSVAMMDQKEGSQETENRPTVRSSAITPGYTAKAIKVSADRDTSMVTLTQKTRARLDVKNKTRKTQPRQCLYAREVRLFSHKLSHPRGVTCFYEIRRETISVGEGKVRRRDSNSLI